MKYQLVHVEWLDHISLHYDPGNWVDASRYDDVKLSEMESVGWLIKETPELIVVASTLTGSEVGNDLVIARKLVTKITNLKIPGVSRDKRKLCG